MGSVNEGFIGISNSPDKYKQDSRIVSWWRIDANRPDIWLKNEFCPDMLTRDRLGLAVMLEQTFRLVRLSSLSLEHVACKNGIEAHWGVYEEI